MSDAEQIPSELSTWEWLSSSEEETVRLGSVLGAAAEPGTVIALNGNLGAGKTRFVRGVAVGLEIPANWVSSPTFMLIQEYPGRLPVYHFDTYRLHSVDEFLELGAEEYLMGDGICLIEWGGRVDEVLPADTLRVQIEIASEDARRITFHAGGERSRKLLERTRRAIETLEKG